MYKSKNETTNLEKINRIIMDFYPRLRDYCETLTAEFDQIPAAQRAKLTQLADYIFQKRDAGMPVLLHFICTHNSRRSQLAQIWAATASAWYGLEEIHTFSGGTEATAFNPRAVAALERAGFRIENPGGENPRYLLTFAEDGPQLICFSKTYDDPVNPQADFAAIMTCSEADENCPFISGAEWRLPLTYEDPKEADGTPRERARYDERTRQIGRELFYALHSVKMKTS